MTRAVFIMPAGRPPSGGDLYNRFLLRALNAEGFEFGRRTLGTLATGKFPAGTELWVDSLYIPDLASANPFGPKDRVFFIIHSLPSEDPGRTRGEAAKLRGAEDRVFRGASGFLVTGPRTRDVLRARGHGGLPVLFVPPAPCVLPKGPRQAPRIFTGLIVSSLIRGKGVPAFLDALGRTIRRDDILRIRIAGRVDIEPETAAACLGATNAHPLLRRQVTHLGFVRPEKLAAEYASSSVLISPSASETFGMAFHEARAFGLPVLALRAPYSEPYIEAGRNGLLFGSVAALARGTLDLARRPERLQALAAAAAESRSPDAYTWIEAARSFLSQRRRYAIFRAAATAGQRPKRRRRNGG